MPTFRAPLPCSSCANHVLSDFTIPLHPTDELKLLSGRSGADTAGSMTDQPGFLITVFSFLGEDSCGEVRLRAERMLEASRFTLVILASIPFRCTCVPSQPLRVAFMDVAL
jgi:hypothetical protein